MYISPFFYEISGLGRGSALLENNAAIEMALVVEVVVNRGMDGGECLQGL